MRPISKKVKMVLELDPRMKRCALSSLQSLYGSCEGRLRNPEWHHVWMYSGKQIDEVWAIVSGCTRHHLMASTDRAVRAAFEVVSLLLATAEDLAMYPRKNWQQIRRSLGMQ